MTHRFEAPIVPCPRDTVTAEEIVAAQTPAGGWTRAQLAEWGVPWPPPKGWRESITRKAA